MIKAELLTIGDEILFGQIVDTNSQWMSVEMSKAGIKVIRKTTVGDVESEILTAFAEAESRADIVLITGGLGPTNDDLTKPCLAKFFNCELQMHGEALKEVTAFFESRGRTLTEINRQQAALPSCCEKITNAMGTAPGMWFHRNGKVFVSMPGVPHEMKAMMSNIIIPKLEETFKTPVIEHLVVRTIGIGESFLAEKIVEWERSLPEYIKLAYLPGLSQVRLRLTAYGTDREQLQRENLAWAERLKPLVGEYIFGYGNDDLEVVLGRSLRESKLTLAVAESCTGGHLAHMITSVPGSSSYFIGGIVAYANEIKIKELGVQQSTLKQYGAVSEQTVIEMAQGVRKKFGTDIGLSTSGIAGPDGGTPEKPVGNVWIAYADKDKTVTRKLQLSKDRLLNIRMTSNLILNLLRINFPQKEKA
jgi:competence/damage-inducible protein CinA C-terminal domain